MNLIPYVELMAELDSPLAIAGIALLALFILIVFFRMLFAIRRGFKRQLLHTGMMLLAAITSFILVKVASAKLMTGFTPETTADFFAFLEQNGMAIPENTRALIEAFDPKILSYILALPFSTVIAPIGFTLIFLVLNVVFKIIYAIVAAICKFPKRPDGSPERLSTVMVAGIEGILFAAILFLPVNGALGIIDETYEVIFENEEESDAEAQRVYDEIFMPLTKNPAVKFMGNVGGNAVSNAFATVKIDGKSANLKEDILYTLEMILVEAPALKGADFKNLSPENKESLAALIHSFTESPYLASILTGVANGFAKAIDTKAIDIPVGDDYAAIVDGLVEFLGTLNADNLSNDVDTILSIYYTLSDDGILAALGEGGDIAKLLSDQHKEGSNTITKIIETLKLNARTKTLLTAITKSLINTLTSNITVGDVTVTYDDLKTDMNKVLSVKEENYATPEEYKAALNETLDTTLRDYGIELEEEVVDSIADYVDKNYSELDEFGDDEFNDVLLHYYDAYMNYVNNGTTPEGLPGLPGGSTEGGDQSEGDGVQNGGGTQTPNPDGNGENGDNDLDKNGWTNVNQNQ